MKFRIHKWTTSMNRLVYTAEYKSFLFWRLIGHFYDEQSARSAIGKFIDNKNNEGIISV